MLSNVYITYIQFIYHLDSRFVSLSINTCFCNSNSGIPGPLPSVAASDNVETQPISQIMDVAVPESLPPVDPATDSLSPDSARERYQGVRPPPPPEVSRSNEQPAKDAAVEAGVTSKDLGIFKEKCWFQICLNEQRRFHWMDVDEPNHVLVPWFCSCI